MALLTGAIATTWYGLASSKSLIEVKLPNGSRQYGEVVSLSSGTLTLKKKSPEQIHGGLARANGIAAVGSCAKS